MNKQQNTEVLNCVDSAIELYGIRTTEEYIFNSRNMHFQEQLEIFCGIMIKFDETLEFLTESDRSDEYRMLLSKNLINQDQESADDLTNITIDVASEYYNDQFLEIIQDRCHHLYQQEMLDSALTSHIDMDSGETRWISFGRSL